MVGNFESKIRVLQVNLRSDFGGGPHHMYQLISHFSSDIEVLAAMPKEYPYWELNSQIIGEKNTFELPHRKFKLGVLWRLVQFVRQRQVEVIHAHGKGASIYARLVSALTAIPCIYTFHGLHYGKYSPLQKWAYFTVEKILSWFTHTYISVSNGEAGEVRSHLPSIQPKLKVVDPGVEVNRAKRETVDNSTLVITTISRLDYQKNLELLVPLAQSLKKTMMEPFEINVVGVPEEENSFKKLIADNGLQEIIKIRGFSRNISEWLAKSHFYLSTSRWEGLPISVLEAMAMGLPAVLSDVTGNNDAVQDMVNGWLYPLEEPTLAATKIKAAWQDPLLYKTIADAAQRTVNDRFGIDKMVANTENLYRVVRK